MYSLQRPSHLVLINKPIKTTLKDLLIPPTGKKNHYKQATVLSEAHTHTKKANGFQFNTTSFYTLTEVLSKESLELVVIVAIITPVSKRVIHIHLK
jgi:hypothetical protein